MYNVLKFSSKQGNCKIIKITYKLFCQIPKKENDSSNDDVDKNQNFNKFPFEKEEESTQEKYKDYFVKNIQEEAAFRRSKDKEFYSQSQKNTLPHTKLSSLLMKRNFLKFKEEKIFAQNEEKEINVKDLENLQIEDAITLYEIDLNTVSLYKKLDSIVKNYTVLALIFNCCFAFSFNILFMQTNLIYFATYASNILAFVSLHYVHKLKNFKILAIEYLPKDQNVIITKWKFFSKKTHKIKFSCDELELIESEKFLENGLNLKLKSKKDVKFYIGTEDEGIWHHRNIFDEIFKNIKN